MVSRFSNMFSVYSSSLWDPMGTNYHLPSYLFVTIPSLSLHHPHAKVARQLFGGSDKTPMEQGYLPIELSQQIFIRPNRSPPLFSTIETSSQPDCSFICPQISIHSPLRPSTLLLCQNMGQPAIISERPGLRTTVQTACTAFVSGTKDRRMETTIFSSPISRR